MADQAVLERLRRMEERQDRLEAGALHTDDLLLGTGRGNPIRIRFRRGTPPPGQSGAELPALIMEVDANTSEPRFRLSYDGITKTDLATDSGEPEAPTADPTPPRATWQPVISNLWNYAPASSAGLGVAVTTGSWQDIGDEGGGIVVPGVSAPFPSHAVHTFICYASLSAVTGQLRLKDVDSASVLATITSVGSAGFYSSNSFTLPTIDARYRLECTIDSGSGTCTVYHAAWWVIY